MYGLQPVSVQRARQPYMQVDREAIDHGYAQSPCSENGVGFTVDSNEVIEDPVSLRHQQSNNTYRVRTKHHHPTIQYSLSCYGSWMVS
mmetsp:Transcript_5680/g.11825  ORF Transcript_5680/g.11825 Transcript_5680/m.11825 type:complete len:88 (-) Transcript_5680:2073-2336(-)